MNVQLRKTFLATALVFILYLTSVIFQSEFFGDLLAPLADLLSAGIIFYSVIKSNSGKYHLCNLFGFAVLFWAAADILWAFYSLVLHINPENSFAIVFLYFGTTVFLFLATIIYSVSKFKKWDFVQLFLDAVSMSVSVLWLLWVLIFDKSYDELGLLARHNVINSINIIIDMVMLIVVMVWYFSIRGGEIPPYLRIISGSVYFYTVIDLCYYYFYMKGLYISNSLLDVCYMATLLGLAVGVNMYFSTSPLPNFHDSLCSNIGYRKKGWLLLAAPALILVFKGFDIFDLSILILIFFLHEGISIYIQAAIANKKLLERELNLNGELEQRIAERTKDLKQKNDELEYITQHDGLTGLYNRRYFLQKIESKIAELPQNETLTLLVWDINRLKTTNSTYGHSVGDQILISLAGRIQSICGTEDILARLSGDEFVLGLSGTYQHEEIENIAKQIVSLCNEPIKIGQYTFHVTVGVGISVYPIDAHDRDTLLKNADISMHYAKKQGLRKCISFFNTVNETVQRRHLVESYLKNADYDREFILFYQPQFRMKDQKLVGMEALIRWNCPGLGFIPPAEFIPIAEESDVIIPIGNWIVSHAIKQISEWNHLFGSNLRVGINISPKQLVQTDLFEIFDFYMRQYHTSAEWIDIEITEGVALSGDIKSNRLMKFFQDRGGSISIDDFGTGYSSLSYLKMLTFDRIKIPKPLIDNIANDEFDLKIVSSIIMLAQSLGIHTICEGVESREQFDLLLNLGCEQIQGYYLGKPMAPHDFQECFLNEPCLQTSKKGDKASE